MTTVADAIAVLDHAYPPHLAESWDKVGLICGDPAGPADTILLALDCTQEVADAAVAAGADPGLAERYHVLDYLVAMEQAYACADGVICRSGAGTVAELTALGLPALYVPLPIGNGEQRLNAADVVAAGGGRLVADARSEEHTF